MKRFVALIMIGTAAIAAANAVGSERLRGCDQHSAYRKTHSVLVFRTATKQEDDVGNPETYYYACNRPRGTPVAIAVDSSTHGEYLPNNVLKEIAIAGHFAGSLVVTGEGDNQACEKYDPGSPNCPVPRTRVTIVNVRSRKIVTLTTPEATTGLMLSPAGAAAWLVAPPSGSTVLIAALVTEKPRRLRLTPRQLDSGQISEVRLSGLTVTWVSAGRQRSVNLR